MHLKTPNLVVLVGSRALMIVRFRSFFSKLFFLAQDVHLDISR